MEYGLGFILKLSLSFYCLLWHSAVQKAGADVKSCSILSPRVKGRTLRLLNSLQNNLKIHSNHWVATKWTLSKKRTSANKRKKMCKGANVLIMGLWTRPLFPMFLLRVCRGTGKEKKSSLEITSKAAILLPRSPLKELIKNRGVTNGTADPWNSRGWYSCCVEGGPAVSSRPRGQDESLRWREESPGNKQLGGLTGKCSRIWNQSTDVVILWTLCRLL